MDQVDTLIEQWRVARPDLDVTTMGTIGRLSRATKRIHTVVEETFASFGLNMLSPGDLLASMMITSGTMTNRIDQLEKAGLVSRTPDPGDARKAIVCLTPEGLQRIDEAIVQHVATQRRILAGLTAEEVAQLDGLLRKLSQTLGV